MNEKLLGIKIDIINTKEGIESCRNFLKGKNMKNIFFINAHCFNIAMEDIKYKNILNRADLLLNDGIGIKLGLKICGINEKENMNGTDFIPEILKLAAEMNKNVYLLGGKEGVAVRAKERIVERFKCNVVGARNGYFTENENEEIINDIISQKADILILGMGMPIQETWLDKNKSRLCGVKIGLAGGAIIDFLSEDIKRAPKIVRRIKMEWIYRLIKEPRRLWKRYIIGNIKFFYNIFKNLSLE